jgi:hypothetical protein
MPIETASFFLPDPDPPKAAAQLLRALASRGLLAGRISAEPVDLVEGAGPLAEALAAGEADAAAVASALERLRPAEGPAPRVVHLYFRLPAPDSLPEPSRAELSARLGDLESDPGDLWVTHPFECWLAIDLADIEGRGLAARLSLLKTRPHPLLPTPAVLAGGSAAAPGPGLAAGLEVRTLPQNGLYLWWALEQAGLLSPARGPVIVRVLD